MFIWAGVLKIMKGTRKKQGGYRSDCSSESHTFSFLCDSNLSCLSLCISDEELGMKMRNTKLYPSSFFLFEAVTAVHAPHMKISVKTKSTCKTRFVFTLPLQYRLSWLGYLDSLLQIVKKINFLSATQLIWETSTFQEITFFFFFLAFSCFLKSQQFTAGHKPMC